MNSFKRFGIWVLLFTLILASIPILILNQQVILAKIIGVVLVVTIIIALSLWRKQTKKRVNKAERVAITVNERFWFKEFIPFYSKISTNDKKVFEDRVALFLAEVKITEIDKTQPEKETCLYVASSAIIASWGLPYYNYGNLREVLVYPSNFNNDNTLDQRGLVSGKVHHGGLMENIMILSLPALEKGFSNETDKKNVGVHEFTHLIDKQDGEIDGIPLIIQKNDRKIWLQLVEHEIEEIKKGKSDINPYGATNNAEFFAVINEYHKERPELMEKKHPELFEIMQKSFKTS